MSRKYKFHNPDGVYFVTFAVQGWVDVFTNPLLCSRQQLQKAERVAHIYTTLGITATVTPGSTTFMAVPAFIQQAAEPEQYYFHPDHLGSSNYITTIDGTVSQHMEYFAFGETFVEEHKNSHNSPYKYNGKELDEETGWYYYGARFYDSKTSLWLSVDPLEEKYSGVSPYCYTLNNPIKFIDLDGRDPIYAKNFWGSVKLIGDDGQKSTGSYLVSGSVASEVKAATKAGNFYTSDLSESKNVMHIPTGQIQQDIQQTATATISSGTTPDTRVENGGHALKGDATARIWDSGNPVQISTKEDGRIEKRWSITPFKIGGKIKPGGNGNMIQFIWHIHPNGSDPTYKSDFDAVSDWRSNGFTGNTFLIDVNNNKVTFFNEKGVLIKVNYSDFIKMGNQEEVK